jgi:hypothetical protein
MGTCTPTIDLFGLMFKSRVDCDTVGRSRRLVGGRKRGVRLACTEMGFYFPPTLVAKYLELWIVQAMGYLQRRLLLQGEYLSYEHELVPPIRTARPSCGGYDLYAIRTLSM